MTVQTLVLKKPISEFDDITEIRALMEKAQLFQRVDIYRDAFRRLCEVSAIGDDDLTRDFYRCIAAYEELLRIKHGRRRTAGRARRKAKTHGIARVLDDWANDKKYQAGFTELARHGLLELTGEFLVTQYANLFSPQTVQNAKSKLHEAGMTFEPT